MKQREFSDLTKRRKEKEKIKKNDLINKKEEKEKEKANNVNKKEEKKLNSITDANIQLISINNNNIIINQINHNQFFPSTIPNKIINHTKIYKNIRKISDIKPTAKENILFPDLKLKKTSSTKDTSSNREINNKFIKNNKSSENRIFSQKLVNPKRQRPFSSGIFKQNLNKNITNDLNTNNNIKRLNINRPLTGFKPKPSYNSNVMNININFYNIDMNKRFLAPEINPLHSNEFENFQEKNDGIKRGGSKSNINLKDYQNNNEFIFQKLIKALQDINDDKKLTINDLH